MKHAIRQDEMVSKSKSKAIATKFLIVSGAHMNDLFIIKVRILVFIECSYRSPQIC